MPTALELSREEWRRYINSAKQRPDLPAPTVEEMQEREELLERIRMVATELRQRFSVRRVVLFGSLAHSAWFVPDSDIDLAVEGLDGADYWKAWGLIEDIITTHTVDLIDIETAGESLKQSIEKFGIEI